MDKIRNKSGDDLMKVVAKLSSADDCYDFFSDLCTIKELQDMAQRFEMAVLLKGGANYQDVVARVGTSSATISRVNRCLMYGNGGYEKAIAIYKEAVDGDKK